MKKLPHKTNRMILRLMLALVLFAQWVMPASAYAVMAGVPVSSAQAVSSGDAMPGMACHEGAVGASDASSTCLTHCSQADQFNLDHAQLAALPASTGVLHALAPVKQALFRGMPVSDEPHLAASPPLSILYCSLLN